MACKVSNCCTKKRHWLSRLFKPQFVLKLIKVRIDLLTPKCCLDPRCQYFPVAEWTIYDQDNQRPVGEPFGYCTRAKAQRVLRWYRRCH